MTRRSTPNASRSHPSIAILTSVHTPFDVRIFHREACSLATAGYDITLLAPAEFHREKHEGVTVIGVPHARRRWQRPLIWARLLRETLRLHPDVIHFHDPELLLLVPWFRLFRGRGVKIVYDVHEYFVDAIAAKHWIAKRWRRAVAWIAGALERLLVRGVDGLVLAVEGQRELYAAFKGAVQVVRNLPSAALFEDAHPHPALDVVGLRLIYVGLLLPQRGIQTLLEAIQQLDTEGITDVYLFLIGPEISAAYLEELQAFAKTHRLEDRIHWLGAIPHDQLKHYLTNADVGLIPGQPTKQYTRPALSTKLFEYLLCGLPLISVDYSYTRSFIKESDCGLIVENTPQSFAAAIKQLRSAADERRAMGARGRAMVLAHYTWEQEQTELLSFYARLLEKKI
ncbi:MAG: glycosyltransferase family 4 protein [Anaerolineae bacterium]|nr:glycosyltransferase family 4 protein [Anaerolineae bacterium]